MAPDARSPRDLCPRSLQTGHILLPAEASACKVRLEPVGIGSGPPRTGERVYPQSVLAGAAPRARAARRVRSETHVASFVLIVGPPRRHLTRRYRPSSYVKTWS